MTVAVVTSVTPTFISQLNQNFSALDDTTVLSRADFRALTNSPDVVTAGYSTAINDTWGGSFVRDDSDTSSPDDGTNTIVTAVGKRYKRITGITLGNSTAITSAYYWNVVVGLGDSLTYGYGGEDVSGPYVPYLDQLSDWWDGKRFRPFINAGNSGDTSAQILARLQANEAAYIAGTISAFERWADKTVIIWAGRNDIAIRNDWSTALTIPNIDAMIAIVQAAGGRYIIYGVTNSGSEYQGAGGTAEDNYNEILAHNIAAAARYGSHFYDIRSFMASTAVFTALGLTPSGTDLSDIAVGKIPTTLRRDATNVHFNSTGLDGVAYKGVQLVQALDTALAPNAVTSAGLRSLHGDSTLARNDYITAYKGFKLGDPQTGAGIVFQANPRQKIVMAGGGQTIPSNISAATTREWTFFGQNAGGLTSTGRANTGIGADVMPVITTAGFNTAVGVRALTLAADASSNVAIGVDALAATVSGTNNVAVGRYALQASTSTNPSTAVGFQAMFANTTGQGTAVGYQALRQNTTGNNNVAVGNSALFANTTGGTNVAVGTNALTANTTANNNTAVGASALTANTTGADNTAVGKNAMASGTTAAQCVAVGSSALFALTTGQNAVAVGYQALRNATTSNSSVAVGYQALTAITTGTANTAVGASALAAASGGNNVALGYQAGISVTSGSNNVIIGYNVDAQAATDSDKLIIANAIFGERMDGTSTTLSTGNICIGGVPVGAGGAKLQVAGNKINISTAKTPSSHTDTGNQGDICWDSGFLYVCVSSNSWQRVATASW